MHTVAPASAHRRGPHRPLSVRVVVITGTAVFLAWLRAHLLQLPIEAASGHFSALGHDLGPRRRASAACRHTLAHSPPRPARARPQPLDLARTVQIKTGRTP
jgi:hypothetical protein